MDTATLEPSVLPPPTTVTPRRARPSAAHQGEYLSFRIGQEEYAMDILQVQEIRRYEPPTRLAGAGQAIKGVVNLRGTIVPVVDLRTVLGSEAARVDDLTVVVVLNVLHSVVGVVVDSVSDVVALNSGQIHPAPDLSGEFQGFILGIATLPQAFASAADMTDRVLIVADIETLLTAPHIGLQGSLDSLSH